MSNYLYNYCICAVADDECETDKVDCHIVNTAMRQCHCLSIAHSSVTRLPTY